jgi:flagellar biosynthetic protein FliR
MGLLLVLMRSAGLCLAAPVLSATAVPSRIRLAIALALAVAVYLGAGMPQAQVPEGLLGMALAGVVECVVGLAAGLCVRFVLEAAQAAGSVAGLAAGLGYGALLDPFNGAASTVAGQLFSLLALGLAVAFNLHGEAVAWLARSVMSSPPGHAVDLAALATTVVSTAIYACALAIRLAFPFLTAGLLAHAALGVVGRSTPQLNLSSIGFSLSLAAGGAALWFVAPTAADAAARAALTCFTRG